MVWFHLNEVSSEGKFIGKIEQWFPWTVSGGRGDVGLNAHRVQIVWEVENRAADRWWQCLHDHVKVVPPQIA